MAKSDIAKDWFLHVATPSGRRKVNAAIEGATAKTLDDIPTYITVEETAQKLRTNPKTVHDWMAKKLLKSTKIRKYRYTTPEWISEFIRRENEKHG